jgi:hypothetical protein
MRRRKAFSAGACELRDVLPSKRTLPALGSISRSTSRAVVDLPQPLSPTSASVSPRFTVKETPSTARTGRPASRGSRPADGIVLGEVLETPAAFRRHARPVTPLMAATLSRPGARMQAASCPAHLAQRRHLARQASMAKGQRGLKRQPSAAGRRAAARSPRSPAAAPAPRPAAGCCPAGPACRDAADPRRARGRRSRSTTRPAYITATSSAISATTPRSWVMRMMAIPVSPAGRAAGPGSAPGR